jgi:hypothetical protein
MSWSGDENLGFSFLETKKGEIIIKHHGKVATILRGGRAAEFSDEIAGMATKERRGTIPGTGASFGSRSISESIGR